MSFVPELVETEFGRLVTVPFRGCIVVLSAVLIVGIARGRSKAYRGWLWCPAVLFWALYALRLIFDIELYERSLSRPAEEYYLFALGLCLTPMVAFCAYVDEDMLNRTLKYIYGLHLGSAIAIVSGNASLFGSNFGRAFGNDLLNPISVGHVGASLIILSFVLTCKQASVWGWKPIGLWVSMGLGVLCIVLGASRGPVIALGVALVGLLWSAASDRRNGYIAVIMIGGLVAGAALQWLGNETGSNLVGRIYGTARRIESGRESRIYLWRQAWEQFKEEPLLGSGLEERSSRSYPHNVVLESFMATGVVGGGAFLILFSATILNAGRLVYRFNMGTWVGLLTLQELTSAMFSGSLYTNFSMWYLMAAAATVSESIAGKPLRRGVVVRSIDDSGRRRQRVDNND